MSNGEHSKIKISTMRIPKLKPIVTFLLFITFLSCSVPQKKVLESSEMEKALLSILNQNGTVYFKTIVKDLGKPIASYIKPYLLDFILCGENFSLESTKITDKEITFLKTQFENQTVIPLERLIGKHKNITRKTKTSYMTTPVLFRNNTRAIYYSLTSDGGGFHLLQKKEGNWSLMCSNSIWIE